MKKNNTIWILIGVVLLGFSFFVDDIALTLAHSLRNYVLDYFMGGITHFGNVFVVLIVVTSLFLWEEKKKEWIPTLWVSFIVSILMVLILKLMIARPRPIGEIIYPLINMISYSFPSMHAAAAFAALPVLDKEFPRFKWFWVLFAVLVGISRVYVRAHYLSDVVAGALLGYIIGYLFVYIEDKYRVFRKLRV